MLNKLEAEFLKKILEISVYICIKSKWGEIHVICGPSVQLDMYAHGGRGRRTETPHLCNSSVPLCEVSASELPKGASTQNGLFNQLEELSSKRAFAQCL